MSHRFLKTKIFHTYIDKICKRNIPWNLFLKIVVWLEYKNSHQWPSCSWNNGVQLSKPHPHLQRNPLFLKDWSPGTYNRYFMTVWDANNLGKAEINVPLLLRKPDFNRKTFSVSFADWKDVIYSYYEGLSTLKNTAGNTTDKIRTREDNPRIIKQARGCLRPWQPKATLIFGNQEQTPCVCLRLFAPPSLPSGERCWIEWHI